MRDELQSIYPPHYWAEILLSSRPFRTFLDIEMPEQIAQESDGTVPPDIRTVTLGRANERKAGGDRDVQWENQWIVGGHWRNQWYESRQTHEPVYILPYVKGPEDKPLRVPKQVLYKVAK